jgi:hypothetical protein
MAKPPTGSKKASEATWRNVANVKKELTNLVASGLGPDELRILLRVARRLQVGFERYGEMRLAQDTRDYQKEASEELLDWLVYTEMQGERQAQADAKKKRALARYLRTGSV